MQTPLRLLALGCWLFASGPAQAEGITASAMWYADGNPARATAGVTPRFSADGSVRIDDDGTRRDAVTAADRVEETTRKWHFVWQGTSAQKDGALTLTLSLADSTCSTSKSDRKQIADGSSDSSSSSTSTTTSTSTSSSSSSSSTSGGQCGAVAKTAQLVCRSTRVALGAHESEDAWRCTSSTPSAASTAGTPTPWVFGKKGCIQKIGSSSFARCSR